jgi:phosphoenolpyruvate carboxylase
MTEQSRLEKPETTKVGYCNPPERTRFKKGQSGNPQGRPKGALNMATVLERTLRERVVINENGKRKTITKLEAAFKQLSNKAASGELKALQLLSALVRSAEDRTVQATISKPALEEDDEKVFAGILKRLEAARKENQKSSNESGTE